MGMCLRINEKASLMLPLPVVVSPGPLRTASGAKHRRNASACTDRKMFRP